MAKTIRDDAFEGLTDFSKFCLAVGYTTVWTIFAGGAIAGVIGLILLAVN